jgi:hypothetical protein
MIRFFSARTSAWLKEVMQKVTASALIIARAPASVSDEASWWLRWDCLPRWWLRWWSRCHVRCFRALCLPLLYPRNLSLVVCIHQALHDLSMDPGVHEAM